ncbi:MAG TPA: S8/S53 family peptidase [Gemmatimonadaceae bacterium]
MKRWSDLDDDSLWQHIRDVGGIVDVGLRQPGRRSGMQQGRVLLSIAERGAGRSAVDALTGVDVLSVDTLLPILKLRLRDPDALGKLRRLPQVEYVEPGAFSADPSRRGLDWLDGSGCSTHLYDGPWNNTQVTPGDVLPWNYRRMWIDSAWAYSTGRGITVGLVDTGIDQGVKELNENFSSGWSAGRYFVKEATKPHLGASAFWHDTCGHGTRMASVVGAPRNGWGIMGVAYGADLYAVRVDDDVVLTEVEATRLGIRRAATFARIVTLAFGTPFSYSSISQELSYWYYNSDRVIFAAAGTSPCWEPIKSVTFPGNLSTVITVTAFDGTGSIACNAHRGYEVDFAAYTDQPAQGLDLFGRELAGLSGSSGATAVLAGVTALYVSRNPTATRSQVLSKLIAAASPTGGRSPIWGFGIPNVMCLMGEMCTAWIEGPTLIQTSGLYTWRAYQSGSPGPIAYQWSSGETTQSITRYVSVWPGMQEYLFTLNVTVRDTRNGRTRIDAKPVVVRDPYDCPTCF